MSAYTDKTSIENYLLTTIDASFNSQVTDWIAAVSAHIEQYTGRIFIADSSASTRLYEGTLKQKLSIDDCVEVTKVEIGDTYGDSFSEVVLADYQLFPLNETPKNCVALKRQAWCRGIHRITAKWGYSVAVPADIKFAATVLTAGIINTQVKTGVSKKSEHIGNYTVTYTDDKSVADYENTCAILDKYKRFNL